MEKFSLKDYKEAKTIQPHLQAILKLVNLSMRGLYGFRSYVPVAKILKVMEEQKILLEIHHKRYTDILNNKGKINDSN